MLDITKEKVEFHNVSFTYKGVEQPLYLSDRKDRLVEFFTYFFYFSGYFINLFILANPQVSKEFYTEYKLNLTGNMLVILFLGVNLPLIAISCLEGFRKSSFHAGMYKLNSILNKSCIFINNCLGKMIFLKVEPIRNFAGWSLLPFQLAIPFSMLGLSIFNYIGLNNLNSEKTFYIYSSISALYGISLWQLYNKRSCQFRTCHEKLSSLLKEKSLSHEAFSYKPNAALLAIDILSFDLWTHKAFRGFFTHQLLNALISLEKEIKYLPENNPLREKVMLIMLDHTGNQAGKNVTNLSKTETRKLKLNNLFVSFINDKKLDCLDAKVALRIYYNSSLSLAFEKRRSEKKGAA